MNRDDVIRMARGRDNLLLQMIKRHFPHIPINDDDTWRMFLDFANEIYAIGAAAEREACIEAARTVGGDAGAEVEKLIRARGQG